LSGGYHLPLGQTRDALEEFHEFSNNRRAEWDHLMLALLPESVKQPDDCDRELDAVPERSRYKPVSKFLAETPAAYSYFFRFCKSNSAASSTRFSKTGRKSPLAKFGTV
jgi:hypothetical protein